MSGSPTRTKSIKGLIKNNNPLTFTAGNAFPILKSRVAGRTPIGKPTLKKAFPVLEANLVANLEANDNSKRVVAKAEMPSQKRLTPLSIMVCNTISAVRSGTLLKVLLDSRSTAMFIPRKGLPMHHKPYQVTKANSVNMLARSCTANQGVVLHAIQLPELDKNESLSSIKHLCLMVILGMT